MVRSMAVNSAANMTLVRHIYLYLGYTISIGSYIVGLSARVIYPAKGEMDAEMIMPYLSQDLFHPLFSGFLLAALFASTISTADSQILVCSSSFIGEGSSKKKYLLLKMSSYMLFLVTPGGEALLAIHANKWLFTSVNAQMYL